MTTQPITFVRDGRRYSARVESFPRAPRGDVSSTPWWFVSINDGPELRLMEADPGDHPGEELYERLAGAANRADAKDVEG